MSSTAFRLMLQLESLHRVQPHQAGSDTQVTAGTTLYIPVAPDEKGASIIVAGNNYNNLTLTLNGKEISVGTETPLPEVKENTYVALEFSSADGNGSCYLYNISVDYMSDSEVNVNTVTVARAPV